MNGILKRVSVALLAAALLAAGPARAAVTARVDRSVVSEQETLRLILESSGQETAGEPDFSVLRQDFDILGTGKSSHVSIINGRVDARTEWIVSLAPKRAGEVTIPPIKVGSERSSSLTIEVKEAPETVRSDTQQVFLEVEVDDPSPYVQAQAVYTMRLFHAVDLSSSQLTDPDAGHAVIRRLGSDVRYQTRRNGRPYWVLERRYAIFPQSHGELTIESPLFTGKVPDASRGKGTRREGFDMFDRFFQTTRTIRRRGPDLSLDVRLPPPGAGGTDWLPAKHLAITEAWSPDPPEFRVGEPVTRTVTITAWGADEALLPEIVPEAGAALKAYPEKSTRDSRDQGGNLVGRRVQAVTFVPTEKGRVTLPPVEIRWWDTAEDQEKLATLPAKTVQVLPAAAASPGAARSWFGSSPATPRVPGAEPAGGEAISPPAEVEADTVSYVPWALAAFLLAGWFVTLWLWWRDRHPDRRAARKRPSGPPPAESHSPTARAARHALESACRANDPAAVRDSLLAWARARWPESPPMTLMEVGDKLADPMAGAAIGALDRALYTSQDAQWSGTRFWEVLSPLLKARPHREKPEAEQATLPRLSPLG